MGRAQVSQDERAIKPHVTETAADPGRSVTTYRVAMLTIAAGPILCLVRALSARDGMPKLPAADIRLHRASKLSRAASLLADHLVSAISQPA